MDRDAPGRVSGDVEDPRRAREVEHLATLNRLDVADGDYAEPAAAHPPQEEPQHRQRAHRTHAGVLALRLAAGVGRLALVDEDRGPGLAPKSFGKPDVVGVGVGQDEPGDVTLRPAHRGQLALQVRPEPGQPGVDDGDPAGLLDEVAVDHALADRTDTRGELHRERSHRGRSS